MNDPPAIELISMLDKIELAKSIYENQQLLISNADNKANITFGIQTFVITSVLGASIIGETFNKLPFDSFAMNYFFFVLFSSFILFSLIGLLSCILALTPRPPQEQSEKKRQGITYFGHIARYANSEKYLESFAGLQQGDLLKEYSFQNYTLAKILEKKMKYVKNAIIFLSINIPSGVVVLLISIFLD